MAPGVRRPSKRAGLISHQPMLLGTPAKTIDFTKVFKGFRPTVRFPKPRRGLFLRTACFTFPHRANLSFTKVFQWGPMVSAGSRRVAFPHTGLFLFWTSREP